MHLKELAMPKLLITVDEVAASEAFPHTTTSSVRALIEELHFTLSAGIEKRTGIAAEEVGCEGKFGSSLYYEGCNQLEVEIHATGSDKWGSGEKLDATREYLAKLAAEVLQRHKLNGWVVGVWPRLTSGGYTDIKV
jgi:hypothetical protein